MPSDARPRLTEPETLSLIRRAQAGNVGSRNAVVEGYAIVARNVAARKAGQVSDDCMGLIDDYAQAGIVDGLIPAIRRFDLGSGQLFRPFAIRWISGAIEKYAGETLGPFRIERRAMGYAFRAMKDPSFLASVGSKYRGAVLDAMIALGSSKERLGEIAGTIDDDPEDVSATKAFRRVHGLLGMLDRESPRSAVAIRRLFGIGCDLVRPLELARELGVPRTTISNRRDRAIRRLREYAAESAAMGVAG